MKVRTRLSMLIPLTASMDSTVWKSQLDSVAQQLCRRLCSRCGRFEATRENRVDLGHTNRIWETIRTDKKHSVDRFLQVLSLYSLKGPCGLNSIHSQSCCLTQYPTSRIHTCPNRLDKGYQKPPTPRNPCCQQHLLDRLRYYCI